jgi:hypothetical protein
MAGKRSDEVNEVDTIGEIIDAAIAEVGAERASPDFTARLRLEIERLPHGAPAPWRVSAIAAATTIGVVIAVGIALNGGRRFDSPSDRVQRDIALAAERPVPAAVAPPATVRTSSPRVVRAKTPPDAVAAVLVPPRERQAVDRLFASLRAGRPGVVSALGRLGAGGVEDVADSIAPIRIEPVAVPEMPAFPASSPGAPVFDR